MKKDPFVIHVDCHSARNGYLTPNAKAVMLVYRSYANQRGEAFPSQEAIRRHTRLSRPTIRKCITELEDHHIITFLRKGIPGKHGDVYRVTPARQISTSTYHLEGEEFNYSEPSVSGIPRAQYQKLHALGCFTPMNADFEEIPFQ